MNPSTATIQCGNARVKPALGASSAEHTSNAGKDLKNIDFNIGFCKARESRKHPNLNKNCRAGIQL